MNWCARHPVVCFFVVANIISATAAYLAYTPIAWIPAPVQVFFEYLAKFGPSLGAMITALLMGGAARLRDLLRPFAARNVGVHWYLVAALAPLTLWIIVYTSATALGNETGNAAWLSAMWLIPFASKRFFIGGGLGEEIGWRGFVLPILQKRWGPIRATLIVGLLWGLWHTPAFAFAETGKTGGLGAVVLFTVYCMVLSVYFTWVYNFTNGSLLIAALFHACINGANDTAGRMFPGFEGDLVFGLVLLVGAIPLYLLLRRVPRPEVPIAR